MQYLREIEFTHLAKHRTEAIVNAFANHKVGKYEQSRPAFHYRCQRVDMLWFQLLRRLS